MEACDDETEGDVELIFGRIERMIEDAEKTACLTKTHFKDGGGWAVGTKPKGGRERSLSKRGKSRREAIEEVGREPNTRRSERKKKADEDRKRQKNRTRKERAEAPRKQKRKEEWEKAARRDKEEREERRGKEREEKSEDQGERTGEQRKRGRPPFMVMSG